MPAESPQGYGGVIIARGTETFSGDNVYQGPTGIGPAGSLILTSTGQLEGSAVDLRLPSADFDVVFCQQGLQFFPDKLVALREMRRVLKPSGRLALSVWTGIGPYHGAVGEVLARCIGDAAATIFCASRQVPSQVELRRLATEAGFSDVEVRVTRLDIHLPRLETFVLHHLAATPVAPFIAAADHKAREKIGACVMQQLQRFADDDGVTYPEETHVLTASGG